MRIIKERVTRRDVITFYVGYDRQKKGEPAIEDIETWSWDDPEGIDEQLKSNHLKPGVLSAYRMWQLIQVDLIDIMDCAIVNHIFKGHPQTLGRLVGLGLIESWKPKDNPEWWKPLSSGYDIPQEWALILRPACANERPAKWYIEDGSGRTLALLQRMLIHQEPWHTAWAYIGAIPDEGSRFIQEHPELLGH
jgi:hypothetical protein